MKKMIIIYAMLIILSSAALSQPGSAGIYGTVKLADGAGIPGVQVILSSDVIGQKFTNTSAKGNFRFPGLPPGTYQLDLEKTGFKTIIFKDIRLFSGKNKSLNIMMESGPGLPAEIITGESGAVDVRGSTKVFNTTKEMIQSLPTARNPWTIFNLVPGMILDREDVGGSESGMQSTFYGLGSDFGNTTWRLDGADMTDPRIIGATLAYLNPNSYEEVQVSTAVNDIGIQTGGVQLNFITKRGGNRFSGNFFLYVEDGAWEMKQSLPESITDNDWGSAGVLRLYQYGTGLGGPIIKDKLWFFGSYAIQDIHARTVEQSEDTTWITGGYGKIDFRFGKTSGYLKLSNDEKKKWDRYWIGESHQAPETAWNQTGPHCVIEGCLQQEIGKLFLNTRLTYVNSRFTLDPKANILNNNYIVTDEPGPDWYDYYTPSRWWTGSCDYYTTNTKSRNFSLDGSYFQEDILGGDHEIRFGVDYYTADTTSQELYPNGRRLFIYDRNNPAGYKEVWWVCDYLFNVGFERISFFLSDTISFGRLTANIGLRYDKETGSFNATTFPGLTFNGTPIYTEYKGLAEVSIPDQDIPAAFKVISPRFSLTYDIKGDGKNVLKASYARYGSQSGNSLTNFQWPVGWRELDVYWNDKDGDLELDWDEFSEPFWWFDWGPWWPPWLDAPENPNKFDPNYNSPILTEVTFAFEKALGEDFMIALNAFYRKKSNLTWDRGMFTVDRTGWWEQMPKYDAGDLETAENWYAAGTYVFQDGTTKPWYERYYKPDAFYRTNYGKGTYNTYKALQLVLSKKLSHGWMLDASFILSDWKRHMDKDEFFDQTNFDFFNGGSVARESEEQGLSDVFVNARWQLKVAGLVQLPFGFHLSGVFRVREGYIIPYYEPFKRGSGLSWTNMYEPGKKFGADRLPTFWILNLGLEKVFSISETVTATFFVNGYNITNNTTTLKVNPVIGEKKGDIQRVLNPGIFQFGFRISF